MYCLSLETSTNNFSLALSKDGRVVRFRNKKALKVLENSIIPTIDRILTDAGIKLKDITLFALGLGPGSFTSLRVGLATVKAFSYAGHQKVIGISSLDIIAQSVIGFTVCDQICVLIDARRNQVYAALYDATGALQGEYTLCTIDEYLKNLKGKTLFVGDGLKLYKKNIMNYKGCVSIFAPENQWLPQAKHLSALAHALFLQGKAKDAMSILPIYLYAQDCQVTSKPTSLELSS